MLNGDKFKTNTKYILWYYIIFFSFYFVSIFKQIKIVKLLIKDLIYNYKLFYLY